jgi:guanylate kinase
MKGANSLLIVISGPSGVGKDTVLARMKQSRRSLHYVVTATTRPQRPGEKNGLDYHFVSEEQFKQMIETGQLLEWATVYGNLYGVPKRQIQQALAQGLDVVVKVDVQGAATIKNILPQAVFIFLTPPSLDELERRLRERKTESAEELKLRMETTREEMDSLPLFDYVVVNHQDRLDLTMAQIDAIISAEKCRVKPRIIEL